MTLTSTNKEDRKTQTQLSTILNNRDKTNQSISQAHFRTMNTAGFIWMARTILLLQYTSGTTLLTFDMEVHSREKTFHLCSLYRFPLFTLNKKDSVLKQIAQRTSEIYVLCFLSKDNGHLLRA